MILALKMWRYILAIVVILLGVGYYVLYGQETIQGNVNINKVEGIDKIYSYSVHSDFYYRIDKYDAEGNDTVASYSKLIPLKTSIGYDFTDDVKHPKTTLTTVKTRSMPSLLDDEAIDIDQYTKTFDEFAKTFGAIVATQDQAYFDKGTKKVESILKKLYGDTIKLPTQDIAKYYTSIENPVLNMKIKYYNLEEISKNLKSFEYIKDKKQWQPNIAEWNFNEKDRIYLQYLEHTKNANLDDYLKKDDKKQDAFIIKTVKINDGKLEKIYFKIKAIENKIECLFQDSNGYIYTLIMRTVSKKAIHKYLPDFMKIAYGINFVDTKNFDNWFAKEQESKTKYFNKINKQIKTLQTTKNNLVELGVNPNELKDYKKIEKTLWDEDFEKFKSYYGDYPNEKIYKEFEERIRYANIMNEAMKKCHSYLGIGDSLEERCPEFSESCMQKIIEGE